MDNEQKNREIDIIGMLKKIWAAKKTLLVFIIIFTIIGIVVALNRQKKYTANVMLAPELTSPMNISSSMSDLASMVGIDLKSSGNQLDAIYPQIYPDVFASNDFVLKLFDIKVKTQDNTVKTYYDHLTKDPKTPFWEYPMMWISSLMEKKQATSNGTSKLNPFKLTKQQDGVCGAIKHNIQCLIDKETGVIVINVEDIDPQVAAIVADTLQNRLQEYITRYRTKKTYNNLQYAKKIYAEAKSQYIKSRQLYGSYSDANTDLILQSYKLKEEDLENEMQLKYNAYTQAATQLLDAQNQLQLSTPAFTVLQSATIPLQASSTPRSTTVIIFMIVGCILDAIWVLFLQDLIIPIIRKHHNTKNN